MFCGQRQCFVDEMTGVIRSPCCEGGLAARDKPGGYYGGGR